MSDAAEAELSSTRSFWDSNPCGVRGAFDELRRQRYAMEPWLPPELARIAAAHESVLEVGCGQGVDSIELCAGLRPGARYFGIDYSPNSVEIARANAAAVAERLRVVPSYAVGNAESLEFDDGTFEAVFSMGVIHHTANPARAIGEVHRVLRPGGKAYIALYRNPSAKVGIAQALRALQRGVDAISGSDRTIYRMLRARAAHSRQFGTMFLECFGVPYMAWYTRREIGSLMAAFSRVELAAIGANLGSLSWGGKSPSAFGYFWWIKAEK